MRKRRIHKKKHIERARIFLRILALFVVCIMPFLLFKTASASEQQARIIIRPRNTEMMQGENLPVPEAEILTEGNEKAVLDQSKDYRVTDLIRDLRQGKGYTLKAEADPAKEGTYPISVILDQEIQASLDRAWIGLVSLEAEDGEVKVKNPAGVWEKDRFRRYDGSFVTSDFVVSGGDTYYFGEDGQKVTGFQEIQGSLYYFGEDGKRSTGFQDMEGDRYCFGEDGKALKGWLEQDGARYYLGSDGKMLKGEQIIGVLTCVFGEDGKLLSQKENGVDPNRPMVALTFDDGPGPRTNELLDALQRYNAHATFFMLGQKVPSNAAVVNRMKETGCELGNHSYDHADLSKLDAAGVQNQIRSANENVRNAAGAEATVMRPPYGATGGQVKVAAGMPLILWNIDTLDWKTRNAKSTVDKVMGSVKDGDIILMHDIHTESVDAAIELIPKLQEAGFQLVTVSQLAAAKGNGLQPGGIYTDF